MALTILYPVVRVNKGHLKVNSTIAYIRPNSTLLFLFTGRLEKLARLECSQTEALRILPPQTPHHQLLPDQRYVPDLQP